MGILNEGIIMKPITVHFSNLMQTGSYDIVMLPGDMSDHPEFTPYYTPTANVGDGSI